MSKRKVKSLNSTGRIARKDARAIAMSLRESGEKSGKFVVKKKITARTTASGRGKISFHVGGILSDSGKPRRAGTSGHSA